MNCVRRNFTLGSQGGKEDYKKKILLTWVESSKRKRDDKLISILVGSYLEDKIGVQLCKLSFPSGSGMPVKEMTSLEQSHVKAITCR